MKIKLRIIQVITRLQEDKSLFLRKCIFLLKKIYRKNNSAIYNNNGNNSFFNKAELEKTKDKEKLDELDKKLKGCDKKVELFISYF